MAHIAVQQIAAGQHIMNHVKAAGQSIEVSTFREGNSFGVATVLNVRSGPLSLYLYMTAEEMRKLAIMLVDQSAIHEGAQKFLRENYTAGGE